MKDEIKEILDNFKIYEDRYKKFNETQFIIFYRDIQLLLDYITNLQEEVEDLRGDNYAYHQLMKMQNKREYRSKFLKEFQQEYDTNTFPDYDEIYKRYDKLKEENKRLKGKIKTLENNCQQAEHSCRQHRLANKNHIRRLKRRENQINIYKSRNEKAIKYIVKNMCQAIDTGKEYFDNYSPCTDLLNILQGDDE